MSTTAMLNRDVTLDDVKLLLEGHSDSLRELLVNRAQQSSLTHSRAATSSLSFNGSTILPNTTNAVSMTASIENRSESSDNNSIYNIIYGNGATPTERMQHQRNRPNHDLQCRASLSYKPYNANRRFIGSISYQFGYDRTKRTTEFYLLKRDVEASMTYGLNIADESEMAAILDGENSKATTMQTTSHGVDIFLSGHAKRLKWQIDMPMTLRHESLDFRHVSLDTILTRNELHLNPRLSTSYFINGNSFALGYYYAKGSVPLLSLINVNNTTNPLNYYDSNPNLHNPSAHQLSFNSSISANRGTRHSIGLLYKLGVNQIVQGYSYDPTTGIRRYKPMNVSGAWSLSTTYNVETALWRHVRLENATRFAYDRGVDMVGYEGLAMSKNIVNNYTASEMLKFTFTFDRQSLVLKTNSTVRRAAADRRDFQSFTAADINYSAGGKFSLPCDFKILTDLTLYTRYGYSLSVINRNRLVWNARLIRPFLKGKLVAMLDGFDILRQIDNVQYVINSQGRTESYTNAIPRYVLLHVQYRFNYQPRSLKRVAID